MQTLNVFPQHEESRNSSNKQHLRADLRQREKLGDMLVVQADASVGRAASDLARVVRAVDPVKAP